MCGGGSFSFEVSFSQSSPAETTSSTSSHQETKYHQVTQVPQSRTESSGSHYFRARYYSSTQGRFISRDPLGYVDGYSLYAGYFAEGFNLDPTGTSYGLPGIDYDNVSRNRGKTDVVWLSQRSASDGVWAKETAEGDYTELWAKRMTDATKKFGDAAATVTWQIHIDFDCYCDESRGNKYYYKDTKLKYKSTIEINKEKWKPNTKTRNQWVFHAEMDHVNDLETWMNGTGDAADADGVKGVNPGEGGIVASQTALSLEAKTWDSHDACVKDAKFAWKMDFTTKFIGASGASSNYWDKTGKHDYNRKSTRRPSPTKDGIDNDIDNYEKQFPKIDWKNRPKYGTISEK